MPLRKGPLFPDGVLIPGEEFVVESEDGIYARSPAGVMRYFGKGAYACTTAYGTFSITGGGGVAPTATPEAALIPFKRRARYTPPDPLV